MVSMMARTRTWSAMTTALQSLGIYPQAAQEKRSRLAVEVEAILDKSAGLDRYTRDDPLKKNILQGSNLKAKRHLRNIQPVSIRKGNIRTNIRIGS